MSLYDGESIEPPAALVLGCNIPHGINVLMDWIEERTGHAPDFFDKGRSDSRRINADRVIRTDHMYGDGYITFNDGNGYGSGYGNCSTISGTGNGCGYGSRDGNGTGCGYGSVNGNGDGFSNRINGDSE